MNHNENPQEGNKPAIMIKGEMNLNENPRKEINQSK